MAVEERRRLHLYEIARERLGSDAADTLMELLPVDGSELATKQDLHLLRADVRAESAAFRAEIAALRAEMHELFREQTNRILMFTLPALLSGIGLAFAAAQFGS